MTISFKGEVITLAAGTDSPALVTREQGQALLAAVLSRLAKVPEVTLDLTGAEALSPSFADELFAGLDAALGTEFKKRVRIQAARPEWQRLISSTLQHRRRTPRIPHAS